MSRKVLPDDFRKLLDSVKQKRPRTVIDHILEYGQITTEDLKDIYGYNHPPRAIRDVKEHGIPLDMFRIIGSDGRSIAAYRFGDPSEIRSTKLSGRTVFTSRMKAALLDEYGARCNIYLDSFLEKDLQIDHRIPFEIAGDDGSSDDTSEYMLLCASANRAKSWSCEHCENWLRKDPKICKSCYWAFPESYTHVAMQEIRRLDIAWMNDEVVEYDRLREEAIRMREEIPKYVKEVLRRHLSKRRKRRFK